MFFRRDRTSYYKQLRDEWAIEQTKLDDMSDEERIAAFSKGFAIDMVQALGLRKYKLDFSEDSIRFVEHILDTLSRKKLSNEAVTEVSRKASSYIGEVMRRFHGGEWKLEGSVPSAGVAMMINGKEAYLFQKVGSRLINGSEDNIWDFYNICVGKVKAIPANDYLKKYDR